MGDSGFLFGREASGGDLRVILVPHLDIETEIPITAEETTNNGSVWFFPPKNLCSKID